MNADELDRLIRIIERGRADELSPTELTHVENLLNSDPAAAERLAARIPEIDPAMTTAVAALNAEVLPDAAQWDRVWDEIRSAAPVSSGAARPTLHARVLRLWRPLSAAAACLLLGTIWWLETPAPQDAWPLDIARDVEIQSLEVYDDALPFVVTLGGENPTEMVWVLEGTEDEG